MRARVIFSAFLSMWQKVIYEVLFRPLVHLNTVGPSPRRTVVPGAAHGGGARLPGSAAADHPSHRRQLPLPPLLHPRRRVCLPGTDGSREALCHLRLFLLSTVQVGAATSASSSSPPPPCMSPWHWWQSRGPVSSPSLPAIYGSGGRVFGNRL